MTSDRTTWPEKIKKATSRKLQATSGLTGPEGYCRMNL